MAAKLSVPIKHTVIKQGLSARQISNWIENEYCVSISRQAISQHYQTTNRLVRKPGSGRHTETTEIVLRTVEAKMQADDETTATQLATILNQCGVVLSLATIKRSRQILGWTFHGTRYCQLIREANKVKRLAWAS